MAPAIRAGCPGARSAPRGGCWPPPTITTRGSSRGRTARRLAADEAAAQLRAEVTAGRLDAEAARAVLTAAGHRATRRQARSDGLTSREVEVLRLLAQGLSNREIAERLVISRKTASHHIEHIYAKTGTTNRALASLYAANHGLHRRAKTLTGPLPSPSSRRRRVSS